MSSGPISSSIPLGSSVLKFGPGGKPGATAAPESAAAGQTPPIKLSLSPEALAHMTAFDPEAMDAHMREFGEWRRRSVETGEGLRNVITERLGAEDGIGFGASGAGRDVLRGLGNLAGLSDPGPMPTWPPGSHRETEPDAISKAGIGTFDVIFGDNSPSGAGGMRLYFDAKADLDSAERVVDLGSGSDEAKQLLAMFEGSEMGGFARADTGKDMMGFSNAYAIVGTDAGGGPTLLGVAFTNTKGDYVKKNGEQMLKTFAAALAAA